MTKQPGRLFWKFFVLITVFQVGSDLLLRVWPFERQRLEAVLHATPAVPATGAQADVGHTNAHHVAGGNPAELNAKDLLADVIAGLVSAAILAWLLSKPIRSLQSALAEAATGNLNVRIADRMGPGDDELRDLGQTFDQMIERVHTLVIAQRRLMADVSHEIRSPMARIQAVVGLAHQQPEKAAELMERIQRESVRIDRLLGELLALSRLQAGVDNRLNETLDLQELLAEIVEDARFEATSRGRDVHLDPHSSGFVRGNCELMRRAVENVVRNAIKYSPRGGMIEVSAAANRQQQNVVISVRDSGSGVPESDLANIFEPYFRSSVHMRKEGSGLGLEIARRVIESHGGSISATNISTGGLRVDIQLPLLAA